MWVKWRSSQQIEQMDNIRMESGQEVSQHEQSQVRNSQETSSLQPEKDQLTEKQSCPVIMFEYFEKLMSRNLEVQAKSALSEESKVSSLAEEFVFVEEEREREERKRLRKRKQIT